MIRLEIYSKDVLIETRELSLDAFYDSDEFDEIACPLNIVNKSITRIKGIQFDDNEEVDSIWCNVYNSFGMIEKSELFDSNSKLTSHEEFVYDKDGNLLEWVRPGT